MFVRQKKNSSGKVSIQVIDKSGGKYKVKKTIGSSSDADQINSLIKEGELFIKKCLGQLSLDFLLGDDERYFQSIYDNIPIGSVIGPRIGSGKNI